MILEKRIIPLSTTEIKKSDKVLEEIKKSAKDTLIKNNVNYKFLKVEIEDYNNENIFVKVECDALMLDDFKTNKTIFINRDIMAIVEKYL